MTFQHVECIPAQFLGLLTHCEVNKPEIRQINGGGGGGSNVKLKGVLIHNLQSKAWPTLLQRCMDTLDITPPPTSLRYLWSALDDLMLPLYGHDEVVERG